MRAVATPRFKSKLWCFNVFGLLCTLHLPDLLYQRLTISSAVLYHRGCLFRFPCGILQRRRHLHNRYRTQICDATHHHRRRAEFLSHPLIHHTAAEAILIQELTELNSAHRHPPILHRFSCNTHLLRRQPDRTYGAQRRSGLDLPDVLQRGRAILSLGPALGHQQRQSIHNFLH